ncbi:MAG: alanine racemase [Pseudomonadota bacterium]|nr:alanine racemase [Pseudomonadota bacterium]
MPCLTVSLSAIAENFRRLSTKAADVPCAAVVKSDAYGLGLEPVAEALDRAGCRHYFVADPDEGRRLRRVCPDAEIFVLTGGCGTGFDDLRQARLIPVLNSIEELAAWRNPGGNSPAYALQFDSGMSRLGVHASEITDIVHAIRDGTLPTPRLLMSHLACAELADHPLNAAQRRATELVREALPGVALSLANSSGMFLGAAYHFDLTRPGAALYGINPTPDAPNPMRPVVRWQATVLQLRTVKRGASIGYGATYTARQDMRLAVIDAGYASGYPRAAGNTSRVVFNHSHAPLVGRVSMDLLTVEITHLPVEPRVGDLVELIGPDYGLDHLARDAGTIGYELLTRVGPINPRAYRADG